LSGEAGLARHAVFEEAYRAHKDRLLTLAAAFTGDRSVGEDVVHDVFASLMNETWRLRNGSKIGPYLAVCVRNRATDVLRRAHRQAVRLKRKAAVNSDGVAADPGAQAAQDEEARLVLEKVSSLPDQLCEVLSLHIWGEMSFQEIAQVQGTTKSTAHARYHQALQELRLKIVGGTRNA